MKGNGLASMLFASALLVLAGNQTWAEEAEADLQRELEKAHEQLRLEQLRSQECMSIAQQLTPKPLEAIDTALLEKANESLTIGLSLLGLTVDQDTSDIDKLVYRKSILMARHLAKVCRHGTCIEASTDE